MVYIYLYNGIWLIIFWGDIYIKKIFGGGEIGRGFIEEILNVLRYLEKKLLRSIFVFVGKGRGNFI